MAELNTDTPAQRMNIAITTTATNRPAMLARTIDSLPLSLTTPKTAWWYLNVDPCPKGKFPSHWFATYGVTIRLADAPCFPSAVKWCFSQPDERYDYVLHLEDDWEILEPVDVADLIAVLESDATLSCVNLRHRPDLGNGTSHAYLSPGLWRADRMRDIGELMNTEANPEYQLWQMGVHGRTWPFDKDHIVVRDTGREWLASSGWRKNSTGVHWTKWEREPEDANACAD